MKVAVNNDILTGRWREKRNAEPICNHHTGRGTGRPESGHGGSGSRESAVGRGGTRNRGFRGTVRYGIEHGRSARKTADDLPVESHPLLTLRHRSLPLYAMMCMQFDRQSP
ncbi:hypothetical protein [Sphingomonas sp. Leaf62]|uniref:hypothetical protein n=1 Tax=Sphingomonas sp. Leaf62 TaxID=1736228 RepID=UPI0012E1AE13|nr:hypothetical protein [Sphingomonas sp. Leaf62]